MVPTLLDRLYILCTVFATEETALLLKLSSHCDLADQIGLKIAQFQVVLHSQDSYYSSIFLFSGLF